MDSEWIIVLLLAASLVILFLEILTPTFGLLAALGAGGLIAAAWVAFTVSTPAGIGVSVGILIGVPIYLVALVKLLPRTPFGKKLLLTPTEVGKAEGIPEAELYDRLINTEGVAETPLRPGGAVRAAGRRIDAMAEGGFIEKGEKVRILRVSGATCVVRKIEDA